MKHALSVVTSLALLVPFSGVADAAATTVDLYRTRGDAAEVQLVRFVPTGVDASGVACGTTTTAFVSAHASVTRGTGLGVLRAHEVYAGVSLEDGCTGTLLFSGDGYLADAGYAHAGLGVASIDATVLVHDSVSGTDTPLDVSLRLRGTGRVERATDVTHNLEGSVRYVSRQTGKARHADVSGVLGFLGGDLLAGAKLDAALASLSFGSVTVTR